VSGTRRASGHEGIDNPHTGLREIDTVSRSDCETVDDCGGCDKAILDGHGFPGFTKMCQELCPLETGSLKMLASTRYFTDIGRLRVDWHKKTLCGQASN